MRRHRAGWSLLELLAVLAVTALLLPVVGRFFASGWVETHRVLARARDARTISILMRQWPRMLADSAPAGWRTDGASFTAGELRVEQQARHLVFRRGERESRLALPPGAAAGFAIETPGGLAPCAVMRVAWTERARGRARDRHVRLVAAGRQP